MKISDAHIHEKNEELNTEYGDLHAWSPSNPEVVGIIEKWYNVVGFPKKFDEEFKVALKEIEISDTITIDTYNTDEPDGRRNLLSFLYMCEALKARYDEKGISEEILKDTVSNIVEWTQTWSGLKNSLYLGECHWLKRHFSMELFKLGRLHYALGKSDCDIPEFGVLEGDNIVEVHIPSDGSFAKSECEKSFVMARKFFAEYFPEYDYKCFACHSWLLDDSIADLLSPSSNILAFQRMFTPIRADESDDIFKYVFDYGTTRLNISEKVPTSSLAQKIKDRALSGGKFYEVLGAIKK